MGTLHDMRYALRMMAKKPSFTVVAIIALALGIGANTTIFSFINALLLRPLSGVEDPSTLVAVYTSDYSSGVYGASSYPDYLDFRDQTDVFNGLAAYDDATSSLTMGDLAERVRGLNVTPNYFSVLGVKPAQGRTLDAADERTGAGLPVIVVSHEFWLSRLGSDPGAVGRTLTLDGREHTIVGVAPEDFKGTRLGGARAAYWRPLDITPGSGRERRGNRGLDIIGRLKPGVDAAQAQAQVASVMARLAQSYPESNLGTLERPNEPRPVVVSPETRVGPRQQKAVRAVSALLLAVVVLVLLIACANVANLQLARASARRREIAIRLALGASRWRLVRQLLTESLCLAVAGGVAGLMIALWTADMLPSFFPADDAVALDFSLDWRVLAFTLALALVSGLLFGLAPALQATRPDLVPALKDEAGAQGGVLRRLSLRNVLVIVQVALSLVLLIGAGLFLRSLRQMTTADPGFNPEGVVVARFELDDKTAAERGQELYKQMRERVAALPGIRSVSMTRIVPLTGGGQRRSIIIEGYEPQPNEDTELNTNVVASGYFATMQIPFVQGRDFNERDTKGSPGVVVVNDEFARRYLAGQDPVGKRLRTDSESPWLEIVGVVRTGKYRNLREAPLPFIYIPLGQEFQTGMALVARTDGDPQVALAGLRAELRAIDKQIPLFGVGTLSEQLASSLTTDRMIAVLLSVFGGAAMLLAAVGLYGVMSYAVAQRTHEIGVRMALGAQTRDILRLVVGQGMMLALIGVGLGLVAAFGLTRLLSSLLYGISATDSATFAAISLLLATVALLACYIPARRAAKVDPMTALRYE
ncbi:MAG TPA: ABC transporter permease [Pyrinomonadaceae bacterium]|nr:ABC transporter permease [Pyrinomonadaceae bacterium]